MMLPNYKLLTRDRLITVGEGDRVPLADMLLRSLPVSKLAV